MSEITTSLADVSGIDRSNASTVPNARPSRVTVSVSAVSVGR
ncbi:hypothetical protein [Halorubrum sp. F4]|nr:hypothetical protein [Halorubrum sp. F4]